MAADPPPPQHLAELDVQEVRQLGECACEGEGPQLQRGWACAMRTHPRTCPPHAEDDSGESIGPIEADALATATILTLTLNSTLARSLTLTLALALALTPFRSLTPTPTPTLARTHTSSVTHVHPPNPTLALTRHRHGPCAPTPALTTTLATTLTPIPALAPIPTLAPTPTPLLACRPGYGEGCLNGGGGHHRHTAAVRAVPLAGTRVQWGGVESEGGGTWHGRGGGPTAMAPDPHTHTRTTTTLPRRHPWVGCCVCVACCGGGAHHTDGRRWIVFFLWLGRWLRCGGWCWLGWGVGGDRGLRRRRPRPHTTSATVGTTAGMRSAASRVPHPRSSSAA